MKLILFLLLLFIFFFRLFTFSIFGQQPKMAETGSDCLRDHETSWDFYMSIHIIPNIKIVSVDREKRLVYFSYQDRSLIVLGSFKLIKEGFYDSKFDANPDERFRIAFCEKHKIVWIIERFQPPKPTRQPKYEGFSLNFFSDDFYYPSNKDFQAQNVRFHHTFLR